MSKKDTRNPLGFGTPSQIARAPKLEIEVIDVGPSTETRSASKGAGRLNTVFAFLVVGLVLVAAIPAASNVPILWALWSGTIFVMLALHILMMARLEPDRPLQVLRNRQWVAPALCLVYLVWTALQTLPFGLAGPLPGQVDVATIAVLPQAAWLGMLRQVGYLALFVLALEVAGRNDRADTVLRVLFWGICAHALWAMIALRFLNDFSLWGEKTSYAGAATGTFINRNTFAAFLGVGFVSGAAIVADLVNVPRIRKAGSTRQPRASLVEILVPCLGMALLFFTILATQSRMGLAAAILGAAVVFAIMRMRQNIGGLRALAEALGLILLLFGPVVAISGTGVIERALDIGDESNGRLLLWQQALSMVHARPVAGYGLDSFYAAFELFHKPPLSSAVVWEYVHNSYLSLWVEAGVIAGSLPILAGAIVIWRAFSRARQARTHFSVPAAGVGAGVLMALSSAVDFPLEMQANMFLFVVLMAVASAPRGRQLDSE